MKPRIVKFTGTFGTEVQNGVGRFLAGLHEWSKSQGYPLHVFTAGDHTDAYSGAKNIRALAFPLPGAFQTIPAYYPLEGRRKQLRRAVKELQPDIVHLSTPEAIGSTGLWVARKYHYPVAGIYHTDFPFFASHIVRDAIERQLRERGSAGLAESAFGPLWRRLKPGYETRTHWWERWVLGFVLKRVVKRHREELDLKADRAAEWFASSAQAMVQETMARFYGQFQLVIARSEVYREKLIRELAIPEDRVRTLRRGVDTRTFSPEPTAADEGIRQRLGIPSNARVVLYVGRVTDEKNVGYLADSWRAFRERNPESHTVFVVAGSGNLEEFNTRAGSGVFTIGPRHGPELSAVYRLANVFWTASTNETLGQVVMEAQASGVPTLVSDQGAARESIRDDITGRVLLADSPVRWANELHNLLDAESRLIAMRRAARVLAKDHTIEASYRHYWALHEELLEREATRAPIHHSGLVRPALFASEKLVHPRGRSSTHISDYHAGKRSKKIPKEAALREACLRTAERGAKLFLHGDFLDTRPPAHKFREDLSAVRKTFEEYGVVPEIYIEGNHDYEFGRAQEIENLLGCPVAPSLVHRDRETGLILTHGHVSELPGIQSLMCSARSREELIESLSVDRLENTLKQFALQYDMVGVVTDLLESGGLEGLEDAWRHSYAARRWLADRLMRVARNHSLDDHAVKALIHMIGSSDREQVLGQLCVALSGWGLIYGHTHEPHVTKQRVTNPITGQSQTVLLGNCGSFRRKTVPPTWIEAAFPHMELWGYSAKTDEAELLDRVSLTPDEARTHDVPIPESETPEPVNTSG